MALVGGRDFTERDTVDTPDVVIVNETIARRYFEGRSPIGGRIRAGGRTLEIVGVARDAKYTSITERPRTFMYLPLTQWYRPDVIIHVKSARDPALVVASLHAAVRELDAKLPLFDVRTIADQLQIAVFLQRMVASLLGAFGALALVLATVGLYGVVAALVAQRTPEIGMRMALGARTADIMTLVFRQGFAMIGLGIAIGILVALGVTRFFNRLLVGVSATDTASFVGTTALLIVVAVAATYLPAKRAASVDPLSALRHE
jgi:predicted permease